MATSEAEKELKKVVKARTNGKEEPVCVFIKIREPVKISDLQIKTLDEGIIQIRVHSTDKNYPKWYTHAYLIDIKNLRLNYKDVKKKTQIQDVLMNPNSIMHPPTKLLVQKFEKEYGGIYPDGRKKLMWKTERFKKKKDPYRVKMKAMN